MLQPITWVFAHAILLATLLHGVAAHAEVVLYKCKDGQGRTAFADDPKKFSQCKAISKSGAFEKPTRNQELYDAAMLQRSRDNVGQRNQELER